MQFFGVDCFHSGFDRFLLFFKYICQFKTFYLILDTSGRCVICRKQYITFDMFELVY